MYPRSENQQLVLHRLPARIYSAVGIEQQLEGWSAGRSISLLRELAFDSIVAHTRRRAPIKFQPALGEVDDADLRHLCGLSVSLSRKTLIDLLDVPLKGSIPNCCLQIYVDTEMNAMRFRVRHKAQCRFRRQICSHKLKRRMSGSERHESYLCDSGCWWFVYDDC
jgi:hypothetical protein